MASRCSSSSSYAFFLRLKFASQPDRVVREHAWHVRCFRPLRTGGRGEEHAIMDAAVDHRDAGRMVAARAPRFRAEPTLFEVEEREGVGSLYALRGAWSELWDRCPWATPF